MLKPEHQAAITEATGIVGQMDELQARLSAILEPVAMQAIEEDDPDKTYELIQAMPRSVDRTELRTHHITRLADYEYRKRFSHPVSQQALNPVKP